MAAVDISGQDSNVLDGSGFREAIERRVDLKRRNEAHVENRVHQQRDEAVNHEQKEQEFEAGRIAGGEPQRHTQLHQPIFRSLRG